MIRSFECNGGIPGHHASGWSAGLTSKGETAREYRGVILGDEGTPGEGKIGLSRERLAPRLDFLSARPPPPVTAVGKMKNWLARQSNVRPPDALPALDASYLWLEHLGTHSSRGRLALQEGTPLQATER